jgi:GT2 family glycosyltransferase
MNSLPSVSVVVVNYNARRFLPDCLASLAALDYPSDRLAVTLVDNASSDDSVEFVRSEFPQVSVIALPTNRGFAGGNNVGMHAALEAGCDYVALLNSDARAHPKWLRAMVETAEAQVDVAFAGSKILTWDGGLVEFAGNVFWRETSHGGYADEPDTGQFDVPANAAYACGASMLMRAQALRQLGMFDEDYFIYHEDVDLCLRAWVAGWRVTYVPEAVVWHGRGGSTDTSFRDYVGPRNALTTVLKCYEAVTLCQTWRTILGVYASAPHLRKGLLANAARLPKTLAKRRAVQASRRRTDHEIFSQFTHLSLR